MHQSESATCINISPLPWISFPLKSREHWLEFPMLCTRFSFVICSIHISVYMSIPTSQSLPSPLTHLVPICLLSTSVSVSALQISSSIPFFDMWCIYVDMQHLFFCVWCTSFSMTVSRSIHISGMAQFCSFHGWVIFHCKYDHIFFIHPPVDGHLGYIHVLTIVNSAAMNIVLHVSFWIKAFSGYMSSSGIAGSYGHLIGSFDKQKFLILS